MNTEVLIHKLALQVEPVRPLGRPVTRLAQWILIAALFICFGVFASGVRPDIAAALDQPAFLLRTLCMLGIGVAAALSAFALSVPGNSSKWPIAVSVFGVAAFLGMLGFRLFSAEDFSPGGGLHCIRNVVGIGLITGAILYFMLKRAAPLRGGMVGLFASLGAASFANLGTQFICQHESAAHLLVWHIVPAALICGGGILIGRLLFSWNDK